jgi:two-component system sensor histidine kinase CpxA
VDRCSLSGFEELLRSAIENVVRNAIRHTAEGTTVETSIEVSYGIAVVRVRDHGAGVPESMLVEIFSPFFRTSNGDSDGAGLGLAIAERSVKVHKGTIHASNAPDGGLIVEIELPGAQVVSSDL